MAIPFLSEKGSFLAIIRMKQEILKRINKLYNVSQFDQPQIRVYHKKRTGRRLPRYLLKCGCCEEKVEIWYSEDDLEIGGVSGTIEDWREILLPLLFIEQKDNKLIDNMKQKKQNR